MKRFLTKLAMVGMGTGALLAPTKAEAQFGYPNSIQVYEADPIHRSGFSWMGAGADISFDQEGAFHRFTFGNRTNILHGSFQLSGTRQLNKNLSLNIISGSAFRKTQDRFIRNDNNSLYTYTASTAQRGVKTVPYAAIGAEYCKRYGNEQGNLALWTRVNIGIGQDRRFIATDETKSFALVTAQTGATLTFFSPHNGCGVQFGANLGCITTGNTIGSVSAEESNVIQNAEENISWVVGLHGALLFDQTQSKPAPTD